MIEKAMFNKHISSQFNAELDDVRQKVLAMGGMVEQQIQKATQAVLECNSELAEQVVMSDYLVNQFEVSIDEECSRILARRQPTASDLRLVYAVIKTITDLERMGDEAEKIGRMAQKLAQHERLDHGYSELRHLGKHVSDAVRNALDSFARMDVEAALDVAKEDVTIDMEYESLMRQCVTYMMEDPRQVKRTLDLIWCVRALERIGDHSRNIAEYVIYFVKGKDVRHLTLEQIEAEVRSKR